MKTIYTIGIAGLALLAVNGCAGRSGASIGKVFGENITREDLDQCIEGFGGPNAPKVTVYTRSGAANADLAEPILLQGLRRLIMQRATLQIAKDDHVLPTADDVEQELRFRKNLSGSYLGQLEDYGMSLKMIKNDILVDLATERILTKGVSVTMAEAEKFYKDNPKSFTDPATADLIWIVVKDAKAKAAVDREVLMGKNPSLIATAYSQAPQAKETHGMFPQRIVEQMDPRIRKAVEATKENMTSGWVDLGSGISARFYVSRKTPAKIIEMDKYRWEQLQRRLARERGALTKDLQKRILEKLREGDKSVKIEEDSLAKMWKKWADQALKAPETPTTQPTAGGDKTSGK